jgi:hypothetical protein
MAVKFADTFPPVRNTIVPVDSRALTRRISSEFQISLPPELAEFYRHNGAGYFGRNEICLFGLEPLSGGRDDLMSWNKNAFWADIFPEPVDGGPFFFAETCFGDQIGFRWEEGQAVPLIFAVDTFESFVIGDTLKDALETTLADQDFVDQARLAGISKRLGLLPFGQHFAPIVSPLAGGSDEPDNFDIVSPRIHLHTALAIFKSLQELPPDNP